MSAAGLSPGRHAARFTSRRRVVDALTATFSGAGRHTAVPFDAAFERDLAAHDYSVADLQAAMARSEAAR